MIDESDLVDELDERAPPGARRRQGRIRYAIGEILENGSRSEWWHDRLWKRILMPYVSDYLPEKTTNYHGVAVKDRWLEPNMTGIPERELVEGLEAVVERGDDVVIVGGGYGVSTAIAGWATGPKGSVTVLEAGERELRLNRELVEEGDLSDRVTVDHAIVGEPIDVWSSTDGADQVAPERLDPGDVLVMDCEGSELSILRGLDRRPPQEWPRAVVVETHEAFGAPVEAIGSLLRRHYQVVEMVDPDIAEVLVGRVPL